MAKVSVLKYIESWRIRHGVKGERENIDGEKYEKNFTPSVILTWNDKKAIWKLLISRGAWDKLNVDMTFFQRRTETLVDLIHRALSSWTVSLDSPQMEQKQGENGDG